MSLADFTVNDAPKLLPDTVRRAFVEGVTCAAAGCSNSAAAMFRLAMDLAPKERLATLRPDEVQPNSEVKNNLSKRLTWLFDNNYLSGSLRELAKIIRENANDGALGGVLTNENAHDLYDFSEALLTEMYKIPGRMNAMGARRAARRASG